MAEHDARRRQAEHLRRFDIFAPALDQRRAARGARVVGPLHRHQRDHDVGQARLEQRQQDQRQQDRRKRQLQIGDPHDQRLDAPARETGDQPQHRPQRQRDHRAHGPHAHADAQAVEDGGQDVAALVVRAEQEGHAGAGLLARGEARIEHIQLGQIVRILRRDPRRDDRHDDDDGQHDHADHRHAAGAELSHEAAQRRFFSGRRGGRGGGSRHVSPGFRTGARADRARHRSSRPPD